MDPINYNIQVRDPFQSALQGAQVGLQFNALRQAQQQQEMQRQQAIQQQQDMADFVAKPGKTAEDFMNMTLKYPQLTEHFKSGWGMLNESQRQTALQDMSQVAAAIQAGDTDTATSLLDRQAEAARNSGDAAGAAKAEGMSRLIKLHPESAATTIGLGLASLQKTDDFMKNYSTWAKTPGEVQKGEAEARKLQSEADATPQRLALEAGKTVSEIRNIDSQVAERAQRLGLDRDKLQSEVEMKLYELGQKGTQLDDQAKKLINDSTIAGVAARNGAGQMLQLADQIKASADRWSGKAGAAAEWWKQTIGSEDAVSALKKEVLRLTNQQTLSMLPPGSASNQDVALVREAFLNPNANPEVLEKGMRKLAQLQTYDAALNDAKSEWVNSVGHLGKPKQDIDIGGVKVPAGTTFSSFAQQFLSRAAENVGKQSTQKAVQTGNRSYMKYGR